MSITPAKRLLAGVGTAALMAGLPFSQAAAATTTATFTVTADVSTTCFISANNLNFGTYDGQAAVSQTTTLAATCSTGTPFSIGLDAGTASGATVSTRKMTGPATSLLSYGLFQDAAHSINWGNTPGTDTESGTGTGAAQSFTVFGQLPASQFVSAGSYSDTITVTLTF
jgi:spore coat protein U-like protein